MTACGEEERGGLQALHGSLLILASTSRVLYEEDDQGDGTRRRGGGVKGVLQENRNKTPTHHIHT